MKRSELDKPIIRSVEETEVIYDHTEREYAQFLLQFPEYFIFAHEQTMFERDENGGNQPCELDEDGYKKKRATITDFTGVNMICGLEVVIEITRGFETPDHSIKVAHRRFMEEIAPEVYYLVVGGNDLVPIQKQYPQFNFFREELMHPPK